MLNSDLEETKKELIKKINQIYGLELVLKWFIQILYKIASKFSVKDNFGYNITNGNKMEVKSMDLSEDCRHHDEN